LALEGSLITLQIDTGGVLTIAVQPLAGTGKAENLYSAPVDEETLRTACSTLPRLHLDRTNLPAAVDEILAGWQPPADVLNHLLHAAQPRVIRTNLPELPWEVWFGSRGMSISRLPVDGDFSPSPAGAPVKPKLVLMTASEELLLKDSHFRRSVLSDLQALEESLPDGVVELHWDPNADPGVQIAAENPSLLYLAAPLQILDGSPTFCFDLTPNQPVVLDAGSLGFIHPQVVMLRCLPGEGIDLHGLADGLLRAGVPAVILISWTVDFNSRPVLQWVVEELHAGESISKAVDKARQKATEQYEDPTWANLVLYGNPHLRLVHPPMGSLFDPAGWVDRSRLTDPALNVLDELVSVAGMVGSIFLGTTHFLVALIRSSPAFRQALEILGERPNSLGDGLVRSLRRQPEGSQPVKPLSLQRASCSRHLCTILESALELANADQAEQVSDRHLSLAFMNNPEANSLELLRKAGVDYKTLLSALQGRLEPVLAGENERGTAHTMPLYLNDGSLNRKRFDPGGWRALEGAAAEAQAMGQLAINTAHLFIAMAMTPDSFTQKGLTAQGRSPDAIRRSLRVALRQGEALAAPPLLHEKSFSENVRDILVMADSRQKAPLLIDEKHLLLAMLGLSGSSTIQALLQMGVRLDHFYFIMGEPIPAAPVGTPAAEAAAGDGRTPTLDLLGRDLTREASEGKLDAILGRDDEIQRMIQTLVRQRKNNPLLIGEAGTGKTAIVEGLAQKIASGNVPSRLRGKRVLEIPIASLLAGTQYRGQMEERLVALVREAQQSDVILFFDEVHTLVGAGQTTGGSLDISNILKPALARGDLHCIGATTPEEYARTIEKDSALDRRFQPIRVDEVEPEIALEILRSLAKKYQEYYQVIIPEDVLAVVISLVMKYLPHRRLPDKAIDLLEETCARVSVQHHTTSMAPGAEPRVEITVEHLTGILSEWTGVPVEGVSLAEGERLANLETLLEKHILGQTEAITRLANSIRVGRAGLRSPHRPVAILLFLGPSGVGKTSLAYALAEELFGSADALFRLDMSEFMEPHHVAKLIGAPPGYIGYEQEGLLTARLRRNPHGIVLFDEVEKAHPAVFDLFLQLFDTGRLTDAQGRTASGEHAIFILTSNIPLETRDADHPVGFAPSREPPKKQREDLRQMLKGYFRVEFLNRLDEVVVFRALSTEDCLAITRLKLAWVQKRAAERGLQVEFDPKAVEWLAGAGFSPEFGARYLERTIDQYVNQQLGRLIVRGERGNWLCTVEEDGLAFVPVPQPTETQ